MIIEGEKMKICPFIGKPCIRRGCEGFTMTYDGLKSRGFLKHSTIKVAPYCLALNTKLDVRDEEVK